MGVVYEAFDRERQIPVAVKTLRTLDADTLLRFKNEFRALQDLHHPNLVSLSELIEHHGQWFFTMELIHGVDFISHVRPRLDLLRGDQLFPPMPPAPDDVTHDAQTFRGSPSARRAREALELAGPTGFDEARLRQALHALALGVSALHRTGRVHRDIKPSNLLVTVENRVVLLDFGLIERALDRADSLPEVVGTADYMAPEQAAGLRVGPEADWYAVGALLYESLTGRPPLVGASLEVLLRKQYEDPPSPRSLLPEVPEDLNDLCMALLARDPAVRLDGKCVLLRLNVTTDDDAQLASVPAAHESGPFVGRQAELEALRAAFARCRRGHTVAAFVHGESGIGKSALVRELTHQLSARHPDTVVLTGRCYERESVPYKAFDALMDALSRWMARLPDAEVAALLPSKVGLLRQVFPVLSRVKSLAARDRDPDVSGEPREIRTRVFASLRELFGRLTLARPLILVVDDLQWADEDSLALLRDLLRPPDPPALLLCATLRTMSDPDRWLEQVLEVLPVADGNVHHLSLAPLSPDEASMLASRLTPGGDAASAALIAAESGGHPLFINELARQGSLPEGAHVPRLEEVLWSRISRLDAESRKLLEILILASRPLSQATAARAAGIDFAVLANQVALLRTANLVRTDGARRTDRIEPYHDRVRQAVVANLDADERQACHRLLARALEEDDVAPEVVALHWLDAGDAAKAAHYFALGAPRAEEALAFEHAAKLYRIALRLTPETPLRLVLQEALGAALSNAGHSADAARAYLSAALDADGTRAMDLQQLAAEQLLRCGQIDDGLRAVSTVLASFGITFAKTPRRALASLLLRRARIRLRGFGFVERAEKDVPPEQLRRIDLCFSVSIGLAVVDTIRGTDFQTRNLLYALEAGEPRRIARALALEASLVSTAGSKSRTRTAELLKRAFDLAHRLNDDPYLLGWATVAQGFAGFLEGRWKTGHDRLRRGELLFRERCHGVAWEVANAQLFSGWALFYLGRIDELSRRLPEYVREARERGDLYAETSLLTRMDHVTGLAADDAQLPHKVVAEALARWSHRQFLVQHYYALFSESQAELYDGRGVDALRNLDEKLPLVEASLATRVQLIRVELAHVRARAALQAAAGTNRERSGYLARVERDARRLDVEHVPWATALATLVRAGLSVQRGAIDDAVDYLERAITQFDESDMALYAACARRRLGALRGGDAGRALIDGADAFMSAQKIVSPRRFAALLAPGFPDE